MLREWGLGLIVAGLFAGQALAADSAAEAITAFGLIGAWSIDCTREPIAVCDKDKGCGTRTSYELSSSGAPVIRNVIGTLVPGVGRRFETLIEQATRIGDDKIRIVTIQQGMPLTAVAWYRQPGERWETVLTKLGSDKYRIASAQREDGQKIYVKDGFFQFPQPGTKPDQIPSTWMRDEKHIPQLEKCLGERSPF